MNAICADLFDVDVDQTKLLWVGDGRVGEDRGESGEARGQCDYEWVVRWAADCAVSGS